MHEQERRVVDFERLTLIGKAAFLGGSAVRLAAQAIDGVIGRTADLVAEAEKAFRQGLDPNIEDAKILEERDERRRPRP